MPPRIAIRPAAADELDAVGQLCALAYATAAVAPPDSPYSAFLRDATERAAAVNAEVLVGVINDAVVATATMCAYGSPLTRVCVPGEVEPRAVAVDPAFQGQGIAAALMAGCEDWARANGLAGLAVCVASHNAGAHRLYERLGYQRVPERDWTASDGTLLQTYVKEVAEGFCGRCGQPVDQADHTACNAALELEPRRFCTVCRRRMVVQIVPTGYRATCSRHGTIAVER